jgi:hypothetical protein
MNHVCFHARASKKAAKELANDAVALKADLAEAEEGKQKLADEKEVRCPSIFSKPSSDWSSPRVYSPSHGLIGPVPEYILQAVV